MEAEVLSNGINLRNAISDLRALPYKKGAYASRYWGHPYHFFVSYPSKLKPSIAHFLVRLFTQKGETVLDPFSGVGTVPFEACSMGRLGIGSDINPIAFNTTKAKVDPPTMNEIKIQLSLLQEFIVQNKQSSISGVESEIVEFYHQDTLKEILAAKRFFEERSQSMNLSFLLACMLHILHGNRPYALSRRSHNIMPWPPKGEFVYKPVMKSLSDKALKMGRADLPFEFVRGRALQDSVFALGLADKSVDSILTSPPFFANRDFLRMNRIRLWFCGWDYRKQNEMKAVFLEHQKNLGVYDEVFGEFGRVLKGHSVCVMHLGVVKKIDMARDLTPLAEKQGFEAFDPIYEDTSKLESHGIVDRGATTKHQFLVLRKRE